MTNSKQEYNDFVRANLPGSIRYDSVRNRYVTANNKYFVTYKEAKWYVDYLVKRGSNLAYAEGGYTPSTILDYSGQKSYVGGNLTSSFDDVVTATRTGLATQLDASGNLVWNAHNLIPRSQDFSFWSTASTSISVTTGKTDPDGGLTAVELEATGNFATILIDTALTPSFDVTTVYYVRRVSGSGAINIFAADGTPTDISSSLTSEWQPLSVTGVYAGGGNFRARIQIATSGDIVQLAFVHAYRSDLGGMAPVPLTRRVAGSTTYVPTTSAAVYLPREEAYTYVSGSLVGPYYQKESASATNLLLNSDNLESQTVQLTPGEDYTLSFTSGNSVVDIDASIAATAVDVFVYDTSKDSDGGAWAAGYPNQMVIVAEAASVKIYDATSASLTLHTTLDFTGYTVKALAAVSGVLSVGTTTGLATLNLADGDTTVALDYTTSTTPAIVNNTVNDVAMTILPDAPIDAATGLPVPTIAVATDGGVSVIKDDGTVVDSATGNTTNIMLLGGYVYADYTNSLKRDYIAVWPIENTASVNLTTTGPTGGGSWHYDHIGSLNSGVKLWLLNDGDAASVIAKLAAGAVGTSSGLTYLHENIADPSKGMVAYTTSTYNTGWMPGDIKGAFLADTDGTDLVGGVDIVTTAFPRTLSSSGTAASVSSIEVGKFYVLEYTISASTWSGDVYLEAAVGPFPYKVLAKTVGTHTYVLGPALDTQTVVLQLGGASPTGSITFDSVTVTAADADRSVNNNGLIVNGTITRTPVATGADLVAYSGFSASNYLEQPYNSALDFGTGDFCVMGWVKPDATAGRTFISYEGGEGWQLDNYANLIRFWEYTPAGGNKALASATARTALQFICVVVSGGVVSMYVDGALVSSGATTTRAFSNGTLRVGRGHSFLGYNALGSQLSLLRISATAPTAEQIAKIYNDEKVLFQDNAACTLYGTSDAVTALAHDPDTDLLHVGTSAGRSVFYGLRRINNTTTPVTTAISAANGIIGEQ